MAMLSTTPALLTIALTLASGAPPRLVPDDAAELPEQKPVATTKKKRLEMAKRLIDPSLGESQLRESTRFSPRRAAVDANTYATFEWPHRVNHELVVFSNKMPKAGWVELHFRSAPLREYLVDCLLFPHGAPLDVEFEARTSIPGSADEATALAKKVVKTKSGGHAFFVARPAGIRDVTIAIRMLATPNWGLWHCDVTPVDR